MHIFFSGVGGAGIAPLALVAREAGFTVSGSDKQETPYLAFLKKHGVSDLHVGQSYEVIAAVHARQPIDWFVYSSAVAIEQPDGPELRFCREQGIKTSKRDELLNLILKEKKLKLLAVAGTHGKTTTTAMTVWLFDQLGLPLSYILPAKTAFAQMGHYDPASQYFVYEADEFDRNFLAFEPFVSLITGVSWDHHEIFPTREDYQQAFREFISQSGHTVLWQEDFDYLSLEAGPELLVQDSANPQISELKLKGLYNRLDAWLVVTAVHRVTGEPIDKLLAHLDAFPGLQRRMEPIAPNLYSDYAHTPEKIRGAMSVALEMATETSQRVVVVYEPLTDRRQHYMFDDYRDCFAGAAKVYWLPSYLAREDPAQRILTPAELIQHLADPSLAEARERDRHLKTTIEKHLKDGDMVICLAGGGGGSLDDWLRQEFAG